MHQYSKFGFIAMAYLKINSSNEFELLDVISINLAAEFREKKTEFKHLILKEIFERLKP